MPELISPQLATLAEHAPIGDDWLSEIKFDGYRAVCRIEQGEAKLYTRAGNDWTDKWKEIARAAASLPVDQAWLDGEVVAIAPDGSISFQALQNLARKNQPARLAYYVFDLVYLNGYDLSQVPLLQRKELLKTVLDNANLNNADDNIPLLYSDHIAGSAQQVFEHACMHGMEGIVVKRADAGYQQLRARSWLKVKCMQRQEFVIGGYTDPAGSREKFGALLVGVYDDKQRLQYSGRVGTGFGDELLRDLHSRFSKLEQSKPPFANPPTGAEARGVHWLKPELVAEVNFAQWTDAGIIRHASFAGLRTDKPSKQIIKEEPLSDRELQQIEQQARQAQGKTPRKRAKEASHAADELIEHTTRTKPQSSNVAGVEISHPAKILFPSVGLNKLDLAQYYMSVADWILPHLHNRPLALVRCPEGGEKKCFFQKHANESVVEDIERIEVPEGKGHSIYMMATKIKSVIGFVQMGVLELHTWGSQRGHLEQPDRIVFDLDPAEGLEWQRVIEAAQLVRGLLQEIKLTSFVKTTGGKGLHVVVPIVPEHGWDEIKAFSKAIAEHMEHTLPDRFTANMAKAKRTNKIFVDYLRNGLGATAVAAYSTRAKPNASVSAPIFWEELGPKLRSDTFTVQNIHERLANLTQDPWQDYFKLKQRITAKMLGIF